MKQYHIRLDQHLFLVLTNTPRSLSSANSLSSCSLHTFQANFLIDAGGHPLIADFGSQG